MRFEDSFRVEVPTDVAWAALTDIERVYPCLPGAELEEVRDDEFHGRVRLKIGPITASYSGTARFESIDAEAGRLVIHAQGRDRHGQGTATARIHASVTGDGDGTVVAMTNEIDITGKAAQFGRGVLVDVSKQMMGQFAECLQATLTSVRQSDQARSSGQASSPGSSGGTQPQSAPMDVVSLARHAVGRRAGESPMPLLVGVAVVLALLILRKKRR
jgi:carbon monoxide dehydrogenase subunit G